MGNSGSTNKISAQDRAILDMKVQRDKLHQYQKRIVVITTREKDIARECLRKNDKEKALLALRRKKYQESLLAKADEQLAQLEILTNDIEFAQLQKSVIFGLQQGTNVLNQIHKEMGGLENVEKLMGESEDAHAYQREINEMLSGQMSNQDEDEVEDELDALEVEVSGMKLPVAPKETLPVDTTPERETLPEAPKEAPRERARRRAEELGSEQAAEPVLA